MPIAEAEGVLHHIRARNINESGSILINALNPATTLTRSAPSSDKADTHFGRRTKKICSEPGAMNGQNRRC
jgi:hypothetical protein